jgi:hypothetical protein
VQDNPKLAAALLLVAQHYEKLGREANPLGAPYLVKNHTTNEQDRVYVRLLVALLRRQFGKRLAGERLGRTVATVASITLDRTITESRCAIGARTCTNAPLALLDSEIGRPLALLDAKSARLM